MVPRPVACQVLRRTEQIIGFEAQIQSWADAVDSPNEIVRKAGYF